MISSSGKGRDVGNDRLFTTTNQMVRPIAENTALGDREVIGSIPLSDNAPNPHPTPAFVIPLAFPFPNPVSLL